MYKLNQLVLLHTHYCSFTQSTYLHSMCLKLKIIVIGILRLLLLIVSSGKLYSKSKIIFASGIPTPFSLTTCPRILELNASSEIVGDFLQPEIKTQGVTLLSDNFIYNNSFNYRLYFIVDIISSQNYKLIFIPTYHNLLKERITISF